MEGGQLDADDAAVAEETGVVTTAVGHDPSEPFSQQPIDDLLATASADATDVMLGEPPAADVDAEARNDRAANARVVEFERQPAGLGAGDARVSARPRRRRRRRGCHRRVDDGVRRERLAAALGRDERPDDPPAAAPEGGSAGGSPAIDREVRLQPGDVGDYERPAFSQDVVVNFLLDRFGAKLKVLRVSRSSLVRTLGSERHALLVGRHGSVQHIVAVTRGEGREGRWVLHDCDSEGPVVLGDDESDGARWHSAPVACS